MQQIPIFQACAISLKRHNRILLRNISLELTFGTVWQIIGANGAGKTSLLKCLCGLLKPQQGLILWQGSNITADRLTFQAETLYLSDKAGLKGYLTPKENLQLWITLRQKPLAMSIEQVLGKMGLLHHKHIPCKALSTGQLQRVMLSRLLLEEVRLWILDEPFINLDQQGVTLLLEFIQHFVQRGGMLIFTSHYDIDLANLRVQKLFL